MIEKIRSNYINQISTFLLAFILSYTSTAQKVGIGSTQFTPSSTLDVKGNSTIGSGYAGSNEAPTNGVIVEGNMGVGTHTPAEKLDVSGKTKTSTIQITGGSPSNGKILLASDGNGNASWGSVTAAAGYGAGSGGSGCCNDWTLVAVANSTYAGIFTDNSTGYTLASNKEYLAYLVYHTAEIAADLAITDNVFLTEFAEFKNTGTAAEPVIEPSARTLLVGIGGYTVCTYPVYICGRRLNGNAASVVSLATMITATCGNLPQVKLRGDGVVLLYDDSNTRDYGLYLFER